MINSKGNTGSDLSDVIDQYTSDDRLVRFADILKRKIESDNRADLDEFVTQHTMEAYWCDLGGEGA